MRPSVDAQPLKDRYALRPNFERGDLDFWSWLVQKVGLSHDLASEIRQFKEHFLQTLPEAQANYESQLEQSLVVLSSFLDAAPTASDRFCRVDNASSILPADIELIQFQDRYIFFVTVEGELGRVTVKRAGGKTSRTIGIRNDKGWSEIRLDDEIELKVGTRVQIIDPDSIESFATLSCVPIILACGERANVTIGSKVHKNVLMQTGDIIPALLDARVAVYQLIKDSTDLDVINNLLAEAEKINQALALAKQRQIPQRRITGANYFEQSRISE